MAASASSSERLQISVIPKDKKMRSENQTWFVSRIVEEYVPPTESAEKQEHARVRVPDCQRAWAWEGKRGRQRQMKIILSILYQYPVPPPILSFSRNDQGGDLYEIYDGRHRVETIQRFYNNKFPIICTVNGKKRDVYYSDLNDYDQMTFNRGMIPMIIAKNASQDDLNDIYERLNDSVTLKDKDHLWAAKKKPLIQHTFRMLERFKERILKVMKIDCSPDKEKFRDILPNWIAITVGVNENDASTMTTSHIKLAPFLDRPLHDDDRIEQFIALLLTLYENAERHTPTNNKSKDKALGKIGKYTVFFADDLFRTREANLAKNIPCGTTDQSILDKWTKIIAHDRKVNYKLVQVSGAQNINAAKLARMRNKIDHWITTGDVIDEDCDDDDDFHEIE
jgi:hypothetical protein